MGRATYILIFTLCFSFLFVSCGMKERLDRLNNELAQLRTKLDELKTESRNALQNLDASMQNMVSQLKTGSQQLIDDAFGKFLTAYLAMRADATVTAEHLMAQLGPTLMKSLGSLPESELKAISERFSAVLDRTQAGQKFAALADEASSVLPSVGSLINQAQGGLSSLSQGKSKTSTSRPDSVSFPDSEPVTSPVIPTTKGIISGAKPVRFFIPSRPGQSANAGARGAVAEVAPGFNDVVRLRNK